MSLDGEKNLAVVWVGRLADLLGFLQGVLRDVGVWPWFFDGHNVVICMVNVEKKPCVFSDGKIRHEFELYFLSISGQDRRRDGADVVVELVWQVHGDLEVTCDERNGVGPTGV
jgi:hypothetical protein